MSAVEIEIEAGGEMPKKELTTAEKTSLLEELKGLLGLTGEYRSMDVDARNAAVEAVMSKLKGEPAGD